MSVRVLIVDDHPVVRRGLRAVLAAEEAIDIAAEAGTAAEAIRIVAGGGVDVILMDLNLGDGPDGVAAIREIRRWPSSPPVIVLTTYDSEADIVRAIEAGADGYLLKDSEPEDLVEAITSAAGGESPLGPPVASRLLRRVRRARSVLTPRELEILQAAAEGLGNRAIAARLHISEGTVKSHLVHVFEKLDAGSRTQAINTARASGIL